MTSSVRSQPSAEKWPDLGRRCVRKALRMGASLADRPLAAAMPTLHRKSSSETPAIFIVGCPRTGSTLFYQSLAYSFRFSYINNVIAHFPHSGPMAAWALRADKWRITDDFASEYGATEGIAGPSEAGAFWNLVFPWQDHHTVEPGDWSEDRQRFAVRHIGAFVDLYDAPFLCKNVWHSVRLTALDRAFRRAVFIVMQRDPLLTAQSVLDKQRRSLGRNGGFWSIRPRELLDKLDLPLPQQVAWQLVYTMRSIETARRTLGEQRFFTLPYEDFCRDPELWLDQVGNFLHGQGVAVKRRAHIKQRFRIHGHDMLSRDDRTAIEQILATA